MSTFYTDSASIKTLTVTNLTAITSSIQYFTSSQFDVGSNLITVNTNTPLRYGGIAVADSGSSPIVSGSLLFDSENNQWIFVHQQAVGSPSTSSVLIMGPQTFNDIGNETTIIPNRLTKGQQGDLGEHITSSNITDTGTFVSINSNTEITGSLKVTAGITGTASYATQALSASYAPYTTGNLATAQARRTTGYTLTLLPALITFNATDTENQPTIVSHDNTNTDRIYVYSSGLYSIHYHADIAQGTTTNDYEFAVTKNTLTILNGGLIDGKNSSTDKTTVGVTTQEILTAGDYVSLAARYVAASGGIVNNAVLSVTKMEGVAGPTGPSGSAGAPGGVTSIVAGTNVTISPISGLGDVTINAAGGSGTPGGATGEVQYNNAGAFGGVPTLTYNGTTLQATGSFSGSFTGDGSGLTGLPSTSGVTRGQIISQIQVTYPFSGF